tara:strand:+ start:451 stop:1221 length:771 start_codon:yes stop_codon:yes gene_type:complete
MTRKSRKVRIDQAQDLVVKYEAAGLENDRTCSFAREMIDRLNNNKSLSTKQRTWLDSLIDKGVPKAKNPELVNQILLAANLKGMEHKKEFLVDFAGRLRRGWSLSKKQEIWLHEMLEEANYVQQHGPWFPDEKLQEDLKNIDKLGAAKNNMYWLQRPMLSKAYNAAQDYLDDPQNNAIDKWTCDKLLKSFKRPLKELNDPKHSIGDMRYVFGEVCIITGAPSVTAIGCITYPVMIQNTAKIVRAKNIKKRLYNFRE